MELRSDCAVTVYCLTYNHEKYIGKTLEGFVSQRTNFPFQVIVHDDASTDGTASVIRSYEEKYPELIKAVYQTENQYSQKKPIVRGIIAPLIRGKYAACCEGDDYWCDPEKLQKQYDYMESHPDCSLCVHNTLMINEDGSSSGEWFNYCTEERDFSLDEIISARGGGLFQTSSYFWPAKDFVVPKEFGIKGIGDYPLAIYRASRGRVHYLPEVMSCYRIGSANSWVRKNHADPEKLRAFTRNMTEGLERISKVLGGGHANAVKDAEDQYLLDDLIRTHGALRLVLKPGLWKAYFKRKARISAREKQKAAFLKEMGIREDVRNH